MWSDAQQSVATHTIFDVYSSTMKFHHGLRSYNYLHLEIKAICVCNSVLNNRHGQLNGIVFADEAHFTLQLLDDRIKL
ncbi:hypothetical protein TNCV_1413861 [Trichonephila clavipes]|nr:hypothetical protein TNCV_1413861 [Trichonephila clavipes]